MTLREEIVAKVQVLPENALLELSEVIEKLQEKQDKPGFLKRLQQIKIKDLPPDYSRNIDLYLSGEKKIDEVTD